MNAFEELGTGPSLSFSGDSGAYSFIDADTIRGEDGKDYRIQGIDAPELTKYFGDIQEGTAGGTAALETISNLAAKQGFTNVVKTGEFDTGGERELIDLQDKDGRSFRQMLLGSGVLSPTAFTEKSDRIAYELGKNAREEQFFSNQNPTDDWSKAKAAIDTAIADETTRDVIFKKTAIDEAELANAKKYGYLDYYNRNDVVHRNFDRDLDNKSNSPFSTSLDVGLKGVKESMFGAMELLGDTTGWDWASEIGEDGIKRVRNQIANLPQVTTDFKDIDGVWGKDGVVSYITNNAAMSLPYMAITIGSALIAPPVAGAFGVTSAAGGLAAAVTAPSVVYAGQVYAEQDEKNKNAAAALSAGVAQAVLDRVGLSAIAPKTMLTKAGRDTVINKLMSTRNISKDDAAQLLNSMTKLELSNVAGDAAKFAKAQLAKRALARNFVKRVGVGALGEGTTEAMQEAIGYTAAHTANNFEDWDAGQFINRIQQAAVAGTSLGGTFAAPSSIYDAGVWADIAYRKAPAGAKAKSLAGQRSESDIRKFGHQVNVQDRNNELDTIAPDAKKAGSVRSDRVSVDNIDFNDRVDAEKDRRKGRSVGEHAKDLWKSVPGLWRGLTRQAFDEELISKSDTARWMGEGFGGSLQRSTSGAAYENKKHHEISKLRNIIGPVNEIMHSFGIKETRANRKSFSDMFYATAQQAMQKAKVAGRRKIDINRDLDPSQRTPEMVQLITNLNNMSNKMYQDQKKYNPKLGYIQDYLLKYKSFDKEAIEGNKEGFVQKLVDEYNITHSKGRELADAILNIDGVSDIDDAFSVTDRKSFSPSSHKKRSLGLSEKAAFNDFMEKDLFTNISNAGKSSVRYTTLNEFTGRNNEKLDYQLAKIEAELIESGMRPQDARERANKLAADIKDYLDAESGNYKRINNDLINGAQKMLLFTTTITSLPLATLSNFVEFAMIYRGLTKDQIFGKNGLKETGKTFGNEIAAIMKRRHRDITGSSKPADSQAKGHRQLRDLGYLDWEVGAAHTTGVTEVSKWQQRFLDGFFKYILLQQWTDSTRASRAALAGDFFADHLNKIRHAYDGDVYTNEMAESGEFLRNLGMDVDFIIHYQDNHLSATPQEKAKYDDMMRDATFNFINEAVVLPQSANRPKIFQDPRFAMFTQFQGFISTFTANHIPKLWGEYVKRGSPAMKYNAFALMTTMIALGFASQHLKDLLKYGGPTPYLEDDEYVRRGIGASGLLGTGERVIDFLFPIYETRYSNPISWTMGTISGESAAISKVGTAGDLAGNVIAGDDERAAKDFLRLSPLLRFGKNIKENFDWNFGG